ncbi:MAG TPA: type II toxin-antitoxin system RelE/ParE family toxin [Streptosporangiaceae bacterium]|nr:type II toxin-antitoxin system RelE/ParE family toxin [Streptosporangiaceae bacterium]
MRSAKPGRSQSPGNWLRPSSACERRLVRSSDRSKRPQEVKRLDPAILRRVAAAINALAADPRPPGVKALTGIPGAPRIRVGDYRILYEVADDQHRVVVINVDHRRDVYR